MFAFTNLEQVRYVINEEKRTVVCLIQPDPQATGRIIDRYLLASGLDPTEAVDESLFKTFKGIAKCHPADEWDLETGKRLARNRAEQELKETINKNLSTYVKNLRHAATLIETYGIKTIK